MIITGDVEAQLKSFAHAWFKLLAAGEWDAALAMLNEPDPYDTHWTQKRLTAVVTEAFGPDTLFFKQFGRPVFSDPEQAQGTQNHSFGQFEEGGYWFDVAVPLNGAFSDLTAQFEFLKRGEDYAAILHDLHVL